MASVVSAATGASSSSSSSSGMGGGTSGPRIIHAAKQLRQGIFQTFHNMKHKGKKPKWRVAAYQLITMLQWLSFAVSTTASFRWRADVVSVASVATHVSIISQEVLGQVPYLVFYYIALAWALVLVALFGWTTTASLNATMTFSWPTRLLASMGSVSSTVAFIPLVNALLSVFPCGAAEKMALWEPAGFRCYSGLHLAQVIVTGAVLAPFVAIAFCFALLYFESDVLGEHLETKAHGRADGIALTLKLLLVATVLRASSIIGPNALAAIVGACALVNLVTYWFFMPYIRHASNRMALCSACLQVWFAVCLGLTQLYASYDAATTVYLGIPLAIVTGLWLADHRAAAVVHTPCHSLRNAYEVDYKVRLVLARALFGHPTRRLPPRLFDRRLDRLEAGLDPDVDEVYDERQSLLTAAKGDGSATVKPGETLKEGEGEGRGSSNDDASKGGAAASKGINHVDDIDPFVKRFARAVKCIPPETLREVEALYKDGISRFRTSSMVLLFAARYFSTWCGNRHLEMMYLSRAEQRSPFLDGRFFIHAARTGSDTNASGGGSSALSALSRVTFEAYLRAARKHMVASLSAQSKFWAELLEPVPDLAKLQRHTRVMLKQSQAAEKAFSELMALNSSSLVVMRLYAQHNLHVVNNPEKAYIVLAEAERMDEQQAKDQAGESSVIRIMEVAQVDVMADNTAVVTLGGAAHNLGIILSCNAMTCRIFGYSRWQMERRNVKMLIPQPIANMHDTFLRQYLESGVGSVVDYTRVVFGLHKSGLIFPMVLAVREQPSSDGPATFVGIMRPLNTQEHHMLLDSQFRVYAVTAASAALLDVEPQMLMDSPRYLGDWIPGIEAYMPRLLTDNGCLVPVDTERASTVLQHREKDELGLMMMQNQQQQWGMGGPGMGGYGGGMGGMMGMGAAAAVAAASSGAAGGGGRRGRRGSNERPSTAGTASSAGSPGDGTPVVAGRKKGPASTLAGGRGVMPGGYPGAMGGTIGGPGMGGYGAGMPGMMGMNGQPMVETVSPNAVYVHGHVQPITVRTGAKLYVLHWTRTKDSRFGGTTGATTRRAFGDTRDSLYDDFPSSDSQDAAELLASPKGRMPPPPVTAVVEPESSRTAAPAATPGAAAGRRSSERATPPAGCPAMLFPRLEAELALQTGSLPPGHPPVAGSKTPGAAVAGDAIPADALWPAGAAGTPAPRKTTRVVPPSEGGAAAPLGATIGAETMAATNRTAVTQRRLQASVTAATEATARAAPTMTEAPPGEEGGRMGSVLGKGSRIRGDQSSKSSGHGLGRRLQDRLRRIFFDKKQQLLPSLRILKAVATAAVLGSVALGAILCILSVDSVESTRASIQDVDRAAASLMSSLSIAADSMMLRFSARVAPAMTVPLLQEIGDLSTSFNDHHRVLFDAAGATTNFQYLYTSPLVKSIGTPGSNGDSGAGGAGAPAPISDPSLASLTSASATPTPAAVAPSSSSGSSGAALQDLFASGVALAKAAEGLSATYLAALAASNYTSPEPGYKLTNATLSSLVGEELAGHVTYLVRNAGRGSSLAAALNSTVLAWFREDVADMDDEIKRIEALYAGFATTVAFITLAVYLPLLVHIDQVKTHYILPLLNLPRELSSRLRRIVERDLKKLDVTDDGDEQDEDADSDQEARARELDDEDETGAGTSGGEGLRRSDLSAGEMVIAVPRAGSSNSGAGLAASAALAASTMVPAIDMSAVHGAPEKTTAHPSKAAVHPHPGGGAAATRTRAHPPGQQHKSPYRPAGHQPYSSAASVRSSRSNMTSRSRFTSRAFVEADEARRYKRSLRSLGSLVIRFMAGPVLVLLFFSSIFAAYEVTSNSLRSLSVLATASHLRTVDLVAYSTALLSYMETPVMGTPGSTAASYGVDRASALTVMNDAAASLWYHNQLLTYGTSAPPGFEEAVRGAMGAQSVLSTAANKQIQTTVFGNACASAFSTRPAVVSILSVASDQSMTDPPTLVTISSDTPPVLAATGMECETIADGALTRGLAAGVASLLNSGNRLAQLTRQYLDGSHSKVAAYAAAHNGSLPDTALDVCMLEDVGAAPGTPSACVTSLLSTLVLAQRYLAPISDSITAVTEEGQVTELHTLSSLFVAVTAVCLVLLVLYHLLIFSPLVVRTNKDIKEQRAMFLMLPASTIERLPKLQQLVVSLVEADEEMARKGSGGSGSRDDRLSEKERTGTGDEGHSMTE